MLYLSFTIKVLCDGGLSPIRGIKMAEIYNPSWYKRNYKSLAHYIADRLFMTQKV